MRNFSMASWIMAAMLAGCAETQPVFDPIGEGYSGDNAALELDQIEQEYEECVSRLNADHPACRQLQWMYDDARQHLNASSMQQTR